jgi:hypothetical protein
VAGTGPSIRHWNSSLRSGDVKSGCLSAMGGRIVDHLNSGHHCSSSNGRNVLRIDRADHGRLCLHDSRLARPEGCTYQILSKPEDSARILEGVALCEYPDTRTKPRNGLLYVKAALWWRVNNQPGTGLTWRRSTIPGVTICKGRTADAGSNPWVSVGGDQVGTTGTVVRPSDCNEVVVRTRWCGRHPGLSMRWWAILGDSCGGV